MKRVQIGELAQRSGLNVKTLRSYEDIGVLAAPPRTSAGHRDYDDTVLGRLEFVRAGKAVGLTLGEIREVIAFRERGDVPCSHVLELIKHHAADVDRCISDLQRLRAELGRLARRTPNARPR